MAIWRFAAAETTNAREGGRPDVLSADLHRDLDHHPDNEGDEHALHEHETEHALAE